MNNYRNSMSRENLIMLIMAGSILVFNLVGFIVSYFVWKDLSKESDYIRENGRKLLNFHISFVIYDSFIFVNSKISSKKLHLSGLYI